MQNPQEKSGNPIDNSIGNPIDNSIDNAIVPPLENSLSGSSLLCTLDDYALIAVDGIDSSKFLQGQLTCNLQDITLAQTRPGTHCTHKGRMLATFRLAQLAEHTLALRTHRSTAETLLKSLGKYIVFSRAKLRDISDDYTLLGISGPAAEAAVAHVFGSAPAQRHTMVHAGLHHVIRVTDAPRFECWVARAECDSIIAALQAYCTRTGSREWHLLDIADGLGEVREETIEEFTPQMLNLQLVDGISFTKGCYTGQEIVARMQYRGTLKKAMYRIGGEGVMPTPGTAIWHEGEAQPCGQIVIAEAVATQHWQALAVINHDAFEQPLLLRGEDGTISTPLIALSLPYAIPSGDNKSV